jgi:hypothetical protein
MPRRGPPTLAVSVSVAIPTVGRVLWLSGWPALTRGMALNLLDTRHREMEYAMRRGDKFNHTDNGLWPGTMKTASSSRPVQLAILSLQTTSH